MLLFWKPYQNILCCRVMAFGYHVAFRTKVTVFRISNFYKVQILGYYQVPGVRISAIPPFFFGRISWENRKFNLLHSHYNQVCLFSVEQVEQICYLVTMTRVVVVVSLQKWRWFTRTGCPWFLSVSPRGASAASSPWSPSQTLSGCSCNSCEQRTEGLIGLQSTQQVLLFTNWLIYLPASCLHPAFCFWSRSSLWWEFSDLPERAEGRNAIPRVRILCSQCCQGNLS